MSIWLQNRYEMRASRLRPNRSLHGQALVEFTLAGPVVARSNSSAGHDAPAGSVASGIHVTRAGGNPRGLAITEFGLDPKADSELPSVRTRSHRSASGQAVVEFALVVPILMIIVLGLADLGRVFATGVMTESATRDAAEIMAQQYLRDYPLAAPSSPPPNFYRDLHLRAAQAVCAELQSLPNTNISGGDCSGMPLVLACVHDGVDDWCPIEPFGDSIPQGCDSLLSPAISNSVAPVAGDQSRFVEVRVCYRFTPLTHALLLPIPDIYLQYTRVFTVADY